MSPVSATIVGGTLFFLPVFAQQSASATHSTPDTVAADLAEKLSSAKRVLVESFGEDSVSKSAQAMVVDAIRASKRFVVTENAERADLILKGVAMEKTAQELHAIGSSTAVASAAGAHHASLSGSSSGGVRAGGAAIEDSQASTETISDARLAVRLVSREGDVVWSTVQESHGGKYKGAMADAADRAIKQLMRDLEKTTKAKSETN